MGQGAKCSLTSVFHFDSNLKKKGKGAEGSDLARVSVQGVKSLGGHFACLCR